MIFQRHSRKELRFASFPLMQLFLLVLFIGKLSFCRCAKSICLPPTSNLLSPTCLLCTGKPADVNCLTSEVWKEAQASGLKKTFLVFVSDSLHSAGGLMSSAHPLYNFQTDFFILFIFSIHGTINMHLNYHQMLTPINKDRNLRILAGSCHSSL